MKIRCVGKAELGERSLEFCLSSRGAQMHSKDRLQDSKHQPTCQALLNWNSGRLQCNCRKSSRNCGSGSSSCGMVAEVQLVVAGTVAGVAALVVVVSAAATASWSSSRQPCPAPTSYASIN